MKNINLILSIILITALSFSYSEKGKVSGIILDSNSSEPIFNAYVKILKGDSTIEVTLSDIDGNFTFSEMEPGYYTLICSNKILGYDTLRIDSLKIDPGKNDVLRLKLKPNMDGALKTIMIKESKVGLITKDARALPPSSSEEISFRGSRTDGTAYYVDGISIAGKATSKRRKGRKEAMPLSISRDEVESEKIVEDRKPDNGRHSILTAGETRDFNKWNLWEELSEGEFKNHAMTWEMSPKSRYTVQLMNKLNLPLVNKSVTLIDNKGAVIFETRTDNTGKAELWVNSFTINKESKNPKFKALIKTNGKTHTITNLKPYSKGVNTLKIKESCDQSNVVDILFAVDATGSMSDEINYLKSDLGNLVSKVKKDNPDLIFNFGSVFYRDKTDTYLAKKFDFSTNHGSLLNFIKGESAGGGGDFPEAVDEALDMAISKMNWTQEARAKILFLLLDAPPHQDEATVKRMKLLIQAAAKLNIRIVPVGCSGINKSTEYLMRTMALITNGNYIFLTDHSGVGNAHIKPSTDEYKVETLNDVMLRTIQEFTFIPSCENKTKEEVLNDTLFVTSTQIIDRVILDSNLLNTKPIDQDSSQILIDTIYPIDTTPIIKDTIQQLMFKAYPNPTHGPLTIEVSEDVKIIYLSDFTGKLLEKYIFASGETKTVLQLGQYPSGTYIVRAWQNEKWVFGKIILNNKIRYD